MSRQIFDAALAPLLEQLLAFAAGLDVHAASVTGIARDFNEVTAP